MRVLGDLSADQFLAEYWQRKPLLVRNALANYQPPLVAGELAGLALDDHVESRIVSSGDASVPWSVRFGPFYDQDFAQLPEHNWTLLVQALDLWCPQVAQLYDYFDFLPRWRTDDIMASYAVPGGSVGPHFDQYDVFLIQASGHRRWQIGEFCDANTPLLRGTELQIIDGFAASQEWLLGPGDMLYLPPGIAHWGIAVDSCMTFSLGFRSPQLSDMLADLAAELFAQGLDQHYRDPRLTAAMGSTEIDPLFITHAKQQLLTLLDNDALIADWFARFMTAPKYADSLHLSEERRQATVLGREYCNGELVEPGKG